jgi:alpha-beta hydrolase superfamily lysophospholipase
MNPFTRAALWLGAHTVPWLTLSGRGLDITPSDNTEMLIALGRDPLVIKETRIDAIHGLVDLMDAALDAAPQIATPLLVLYGAHDEIIPKAPTALMLDRLAGPRAVAVYPDGYHMLLRDLQANVVHEDLAAWIAAPGAPLPSGHDRDWRRFLEE